MKLFTEFGKLNLDIKNLYNEIHQQAKDIFNINLTDDNYLTDTKQTYNSAIANFDSKLAEAQQQYETRVTQFREINTKYDELFNYIMMTMSDKTIDFSQLDRLLHELKLLDNEMSDLHMQINQQATTLRTPLIERKSLLDEAKNAIFNAKQQKFDMMCEQYISIIREIFVLLCADYISDWSEVTKLHYDLESLHNKIQNILQNQSDIKINKLDWMDFNDVEPIINRAKFRRMLEKYQEIYDTIFQIISRSGDIDLSKLDTLFNELSVHDSELLKEQKKLDLAHNPIEWESKLEETKNAISRAKQKAIDDENYRIQHTATYVVTEFKRLLNEKPSDYIMELAQLITKDDNILHENIFQYQPIQLNFEELEELEHEMSKLTKPTIFLGHEIYMASYNVAGSNVTAQTTAIIPVSCLNTNVVADCMRDYDYNDGIIYHVVRCDSKYTIFTNESYHCMIGTRSMTTEIDSQNILDMVWFANRTHDDKLSRSTNSEGFIPIEPMFAYKLEKMEIGKTLFREYIEKYFKPSFFAVLIKELIIHMDVNNRLPDTYKNELFLSLGEVINNNREPQINGRLNFIKYNAQAIDLIIDINTSDQNHINIYNFVLNKLRVQLFNNKIPNTIERIIMFIVVIRFLRLSAISKFGLVGSSEPITRTLATLLLEELQKRFPRINDYEVTINNLLNNDVHTQDVAECTALTSVSGVLTYLKLGYCSQLATDHLLEILAQIMNALQKYDNNTYTQIYNMIKEHGIFMESKCHERRPVGIILHERIEQKFDNLKRSLTLRIEGLNKKLNEAREVKPQKWMDIYKLLEDINELKGKLENNDKNREKEIQKLNNRLVNYTDPHKLFHLFANDPTKTGDHYDNEHK